MLRITPLVAALLCTTGCSGSGVATTVKLTQKLGTPTHTWVSFDFAPELYKLVQADALGYHVLKVLEPHVDGIVGSSSPGHQSTPGCNEPACFKHLRETMSVHRVVAVVIQPQDSTWVVTVGIHDVAYDRRLAIVSKQSAGHAKSLRSTLTELISSGFAQTESH